jgi:hypothetical protein
MPFPKSVREEALVAAARHCCVCRRYKGVKVEVHHIDPEAEGGSNGIENAIVLCFDCHSDAGHYNPRHPRGTRYSRSELRRARDLWFETVGQNKIEPPLDQPLIHTRYLICKSFELLREICHGEMSRFPLERVVLARGPIFQFLCNVVGMQDGAARRAQVYGDSFESVEEYLKKFPLARRTQRSNPVEAYYEATREPNEVDLGRVMEEDTVSRMMAERGLPINDILRSYIYFEACGAGTHQELFRLRPLWAVFLAVTNVSDKPITFEQVEGQFDNGDAELYLPFQQRSSPTGRIALPAAPIDPGTTAIVPIVTLLMPFHELLEDQQITGHEEIDHAYIQSVARASVVQDPLLLTDTWGPVMRPERVVVRQGTDVQSHDVHDLDLSNVYVIDRYWEMGCCPHLFAVNRSGDVTYVGELLARWPGVFHTCSVELPAGTSEIIIAELEPEVTYLTAITQAGQAILQDQQLTAGMNVQIPLLSDASIEVTGRYVPGRESTTRPAPVLRNQLVGQALRALTTSRITIG